MLQCYSDDVNASLMPFSIVCTHDGYRVNVAPTDQREHVPWPVAASPFHRLSQACDEPYVSWHIDAFWQQCHRSPDQGAKSTNLCTMF